MLHEPRHGGSLRAVLFHEFQPGRRVVKEVCHANRGACGSALLPDGAHRAALTVDGRADGVLTLPGQYVHPADSGNGRQSLAPEAQRSDFPQVLLRAELAGGVAQKRGGQLVRGDAAAVVCDPNEAHAAPLYLHHNGGGPGVNGVFHQFFNNGGRPFHHLAGGDEVSDMG